MIMLRGLGDCDPNAGVGDLGYCGGSTYGVDSAGNTIVNPGTPGATIVSPGLPPVAAPTFAQSFFAQTGIQFQSAALFLAGIAFVFSMGGGKRR